MRYFKKIENDEVVAFGIGGEGGIEISEAEYLDLLVAHNEWLRDEKAKRVYPEAYEEEQPGISTEERLEALEAALIEILIGGV